MKSVIDTLDEHSKSIKELEQRIKQLFAKDGCAEGNKNIEFTVESATLEDCDPLFKVPKCRHDKHKNE